jgi:hypothetical protein
MHSHRLSGLAAVLMLASGAHPSQLEVSHNTPKIGNGIKQPRQQLAHLCQPVPVSNTGRGLKQLNRKERRAGGASARQQRKLRQTIRTANAAALAKAFPAEQA